MIGPRVDADLADTHARVPVRSERLREGLHERAEFLRRRVVVTDLADLSADGDRDALRLELADQSREVCGQLGVQTLLQDDGRQRQVDDRRRVDVDVEEARGNLLADDGGEPRDLGLRILRVRLGVDLVVVRLQEHRPRVPFAHRGSEDRCSVFGR